MEKAWAYPLRFFPRVKLDVGIGIGSDTDIQRLAISGCRYRMSISETDTDIQ